MARVEEAQLNGCGTLMTIPHAAMILGFTVSPSVFQNGVYEFSSYPGPCLDFYFFSQAFSPAFGRRKKSSRALPFLLCANDSTIVAFRLLAGLGWAR